METTKTQITVTGYNPTLCAQRLKGQLGESLAFQVLKELEPLRPKVEGWFQVQAEKVDSLSQLVGTREVQPFQGSLLLGRELRLQSILEGSGFRVQSEGMWLAWSDWADQVEKDINR